MSDTSLLVYHKTQIDIPHIHNLDSQVCCDRSMMHGSPPIEREASRVFDEHEDLRRIQLKDIEPMQDDSLLGHDDRYHQWCEMPVASLRYRWNLVYTSL